MKKLFAIVLTVILLITSLCGCAFREKNGVSVTGTMYYCYNELTYLQQDIYDEMLKEALNVTNKFELFDAAENDVLKAYNALIADHPELFWLSDGYEYTLYEYFEFIPFLDLYGMDLKVISMEINEELQIKKSDLDKKVEEILENANKFSSDFEKIKYVHDYIIENTEYDDAVADIITSDEEIDTIYNAQTAYGCLVEGKAICSGYSKAFQLIMQKLGFLCGNAFGTTTEDDTQHQWNFLKVGGEFYFVDTTWDDTVATEELPAYNCYEYFLVNDEEISYSHTLNEDISVPVCNGDGYDFYITKQLYDDEEYDYNTTKNIINSQNALQYINGYTVVEYSSPEECQKAVKELFDNNKFFNIATNVREVVYFVGNSGRVLYILKK